MSDIKTQRPSPQEAIVQVRLSASDYAHVVSEKIKAYGQRVQLKGFRHGKVPYEHIERLYGGRIREEVIHQVSARKLSEYIQEQKWNLLGQPILEPFESPPNFSQEQPISFTYRVGLRTDFTLAPLEKKSFVRFQVQVESKDLEYFIEQLRYRWGGVRHSKCVGEGAEEVLHGLLAPDKEKLSIFLRYSTLSASAKKALKGLKKGDTCMLDFKRGILDKDQEAAALFARMQRHNMDIKGTYPFQLEQIDQLTLAPMGKEFFNKALGDASIADEATFRQKVETYLAQRYVQRADEFLRQQIMDTALKVIRIDLPDDYLRQQLSALTRQPISKPKGKDKTTLDVYKNDLKWRLIQQKAMEEAHLEIKGSDIEAYALRAVAHQLRLPSNPSAAQQEQLHTATEAFLSEEKNRIRVHDHLSYQKAMELLSHRVKIKTQSIKSSAFDAKYPARNA